jgi:hypothetical protein
MMDQKQEVIVDEQIPLTLDQKVDSIIEQYKGKTVPMTMGAKVVLQKLFNEYKSDLEEVVGVYTKEISESHDRFRTNTLDQMNASLEKLDKKYRAMYGNLVNQFLVKQEQKVFAAELACQTLVEENAQLRFVVQTLTALVLTTQHAEMVKQGGDFVPLEDYIKAFREKTIAPAEFKDAFQKEFEDRMETLAINLKNAAVARMQKMAEGEKKDDQVDQKPAEEAVQQPAEEAPVPHPTEDGDRL